MRLQERARREGDRARPGSAIETPRVAIQLRFWTSEPGRVSPDFAISPRTEAGITMSSKSCGSRSRWPVVRIRVLSVSGRIVDASLLEEFEKLSVVSSQQFGCDSSGARAATKQRQHCLLSSLVLERLAETVADGVWY